MNRIDSNSCSSANARGSIAVLGAAWIALFVLCAVAVSRAGILIVQRSRTQDAADAVALAMTTGGRVAAQRVADELNVVIQSAEVVAGVQHVTVCQATVCASATAIH